ncbi:MAG: heavy metal-binding domain-containing protein [Pseudomonadales bacterium]
MAKLIYAVLLLSLGAALGVFAPRYAHLLPLAQSSASAEPEPLYWVAPMDPNFRRDKPGLSPMGMALVPVYPEVEKKAEAEPEPLYWVAPMDPNYRRDKPGSHLWGWRWCLSIHRRKMPTGRELSVSIPML